MSGINVCATLGGNTGRPSCDVAMGRIKYMLLTTSHEFGEEEIVDSDSFQEALQEAMLLGNSNPLKIFAFPEMRDVTNNTGDPTTGNLADGYETILSEALPKFLLKSTPGVCVQQAMASFNGWPGRIYVVDENNILWFKKKTGGGTRGFTCAYLYTPPPSFRGSGDVQTANTRLTFASIDEFKANIGAIKLDFAITDLLNIQDVELVDLESENTSGALNNVFIIGGTIKCDGTDIYTAYGDALNNVNRWRAYTADGTVIPVTTVTKNATLKGWNVTVNTGSFSGLADDAVFYIDLVPPETLHGFSVDGIEGKKLRFKKFL